MTLVDASPLVALIDPGDDDHELCLAQYDVLPDLLHTTWAAFAESMHLLGARVGYRGQATLWGLIQRRQVALIETTPVMAERCADLMAKYQDLPMDLADATLVALAEVRDDDEIFTLDSDFEVYRLNGRRKFKIVP